VKLSLRVRLLVGLVVLVALGVGTVDVVVYSAVRSFLDGRVTSQLDATRRTALNVLAGSVTPATPATPPAPTATPATPTATSPAAPPATPAAENRRLRAVVPPGTFLQVRARDGKVITTVAASGTGSDGTTPQLDGPHLPRPRAADPRPTFVSRSANGDSGRFEVQGTALPGRQGLLIVAVALGPSDDILQRLRLTEILASLATLVAVGLLALVVVRVGLRPLDAIADTAGDIATGNVAAGDLGRRVRGANARTEVGRLGLALNAMLGQIEAAFANRAASEERLRRFVSDASHELRTPLTSIRGYAELFRRGASQRPDDLAMAMGRIETEAIRMGVLIDDLLLLARLDQGRPLSPTAVDLAAVAADAAADARAADSTHSVTVAAPAPVVVAADEDRLRQVAANLMANARAHTPPGTAVTVSVRAEATMGVLEVSDDGPGLAPEQLNRVWDRFWRADRSPQGGAGLGLSIVAAVAQAHGGRATVVSEPGQGCRFRIELPLAAGATDQP
jgi:two-component system, OmpR family, sensor kinase